MRTVVAVLVLVFPVLAQDVPLRRLIATHGHAGRWGDGDDAIDRTAIGVMALAYATGT
jgi:hypothetical protein